MNWTLVAVVAVALFFDFTKGFHDAANAIATSVSTRALSPRIAVLFAAALNFAGAFVSLKVAATVAKGIVDPTGITLRVVLAGLVGVAVTVGVGVLSPGVGSAAAATPNTVDGAHVSASGIWVGIAPGLATTAGGWAWALAAAAFAVR